MSPNKDETGLSLPKLVVWWSNWHDQLFCFLIYIIIFDNYFFIFIFTITVTPNPYSRLVTFFCFFFVFKSFIVFYFLPSVQNFFCANLSPCNLVPSCNFVFVQFWPVPMKHTTKKVSEYFNIKASVLKYLTQMSFILNKLSLLIFV